MRERLLVGLVVLAAVVMLAGRLQSALVPDGVPQAGPIPADGALMAVIGGGMPAGATLEIPRELEDLERLPELLGEGDPLLQLWAAHAACADYGAHPEATAALAASLIEGSDRRAQVMGVALVGCQPDPAVADAALVALLDSSEDAVVTAAGIELARRDARAHAGRVLEAAPGLEDPGLALLMEWAGFCLGAPGTRFADVSVRGL